MNSVSIEECSGHHRTTTSRQLTSNGGSPSKSVSVYLQEFLARKQVIPCRKPPLFTFDVLALAFFRSYFGVDLYDQLVALLKRFNKQQRSLWSVDTKLKGHIISQFGDTPEVLHYADCFLPADLHFFQVDTVDGGNKKP